MRADLFTLFKDSLGVHATNGNVVKFLCPAKHAISVVAKFNELAKQHGYQHFITADRHNADQQAPVAMLVTSSHLTHPNEGAKPPHEFIPLLGNEFRTLLGKPPIKAQQELKITLPAPELTTYHQLKAALGNRLSVSSGLVMRFAYNTSEVEAVCEAVNALAKEHGYAEFAEFVIDRSRSGEPRGVLALNKGPLERPGPDKPAPKTALKEFIQLIGEAERKAIKEVAEEYQQMLKHSGQVIFGIDTTDGIPSGYAKEVAYWQSQSKRKLEENGFKTEGDNAVGSGFKKLIKQKETTTRDKLTKAGFGHLVACALR